MTLSHAAVRCVLPSMLSRQLPVTYVRSLHTTSASLSKAQDPSRSNPKENQSQTLEQTPSNQDDQRHSIPSKTKTVSQADAELRERLEQMSGEGGASGIEYEDGKPNSMKRGVRNNMFRLI